MAQQRVVLKILAMNDEKTKQKVIEAAANVAANVYGVDSIAADLKEQKLTVIGEMDTIAVVKKLNKLGKIDILTVGPAKVEKAEKKEEQKVEEREEKKEEKK